MRGIVSHVASNDALAKLSEEGARAAGKVDQVAGAGGASSVLSALESRIATLADALEARNQGGQAAPHEIEAVVKGLIDKIERIQLTPGDQAAVGHLEDRIAKLVEKLDASDARLNHLETIERGLAELLIHLEHQRVPNLARARRLAARGGRAVARPRRSPADRKEDPGRARDRARHPGTCRRSAGDDRDRPA
jgi:localization factor PodJL